MKYAVGIDVGSTYTKALILGEDHKIIGKSMIRTGFKLAEAAKKSFEGALKDADLAKKDIDYIVATGFGRHLIPFSDLAVTDLTASARGTTSLFPKTLTVLDIGGQTMKASRLDGSAKVKSFRLNDKCAAGTGAFLEKTAHYMGYETKEIGPLAATSKAVIPISGVCAVFAESEVINHLSHGSSPADIMHGAISSLVDRALQLMKRVKMEPEFTLIGGIMRFETMVKVINEQLTANVNVPQTDLVQYISALGAATLGHIRLRKLGQSDVANLQVSPGMA